MVAERSVFRGKKIVKFFGELRIDHVGMSNDKKCEIIFAVNLRFSTQRSTL